MQAKLCHVRYVGDNERYPEAVINLCLTPAIRYTYVQEWVELTDAVHLTLFCSH